jgi:hypothetical protein
LVVIGNKLSAVSSQLSVKGETDAPFFRTQTQCRTVGLS